MFGVHEEDIFFPARDCRLCGFGDAVLADNLTGPLVAAAAFLAVLALVSLVLRE